MSYAESDERQRARTIELCVNDLIVRSTIDNGRESQIKIIPKTVEEWADRWRKQVSPPDREEASI